MGVPMLDFDHRWRLRGKVFGNFHICDVKGVIHHYTLAYMNTLEWYYDPFVYDWCFIHSKGDFRIKIRFSDHSGGKYEGN